MKYNCEVFQKNAARGCADHVFHHSCIPYPVSEYTADKTVWRIDGKYISESAALAVLLKFDGQCV